MKSRLEKARRIVVKVGSALLVDEKSGTLKASWLSSLVDDIADLRVGGAEVILVSSGAIALGRRTLGLPKGKLELPQKQAAAAENDGKWNQSKKDPLAERLAEGVGRYRRDAGETHASHDAALPGCLEPP